MFKKILVPVAIFSLFFVLLGASVALAQEPEPGSDLTPRQLLLLQVQENAKREAEWDRWKISWELMHDTAWGPSDFVTLKKEDQLWIIAAIGNVPKMLTIAVAATRGENFAPGFIAYFKDDTLDVFFSVIQMDGEYEALKNIAKRATNYLSSALKALELETDDELVDLIKRGLGAPKKATHL